jgi:hypothetical protein
VKRSNGHPARETAETGGRHGRHCRPDPSSVAHADATPSLDIGPSKAGAPASWAAHRPRAETQPPGVAAARPLMPRDEWLCTASERAMARGTGTSHRRRCDQTTAGSRRSHTTACCSRPAARPAITASSGQAPVRRGPGGTAPVRLPRERHLG